MTNSHAKEFIKAIPETRSHSLESFDEELDDVRSLSDMETRQTKETKNTPKKAPEITDFTKDITVGK